MSSKPQILYVDDESNNLSVFRSSFRRKYQLYLAESGKQALEVLSENPGIQLIITDQKMPSMTGVDLLRVVVKEYPDKVRMVLTGYSETSAVIAAVNECDIFRYMTKPWSLGDMQNAIDKALETYGLRKKNEALVAELKELNASLEERVQKQVEELKQGREELAKANHRLTKSNRELQKSELRYRGIAENIPNGFVFVMSSSLTYNFISGEAVKNAHLDAEDVVGKHLSEVHETYTASQMQYHYHRALEVGKQEFEVELWEEDYAISCLPLKDDEGQIKGILAIGQNITGKKKEQQAVAHRRDFLSKVFDTTPCLLYVIDLSAFSITYINKRVERLMGYTPDHILSFSRKQWKNYIYPEDSVALLQHIRAAQKLRDNEVRVDEFRFKHKNGHYIWLRATATVFQRKDDGIASTLLSYVEDVSRYKMAESQIKEQSAFLSQINTLSPNLIFITEWPSLNITYHNKQLEKTLGYSASGIRAVGGDLFKAILHHEDLQGLMQHFSVIIEGGDNTKGTAVYRVKDKVGNWRWMYASSILFRIHGQDKEQILTMAQDITELKEVEIALQRSEERLLETQKLARVGRWEMDVETQRVHWFGPRGELSKAREAEGMSTFSDYINYTHPKDAPRIMANHEQLVKQGEPYEMDIAYQVPQSGKEAYLHLKARPVYQGGKVTKVVGSAMDITQLKAFEKKLKKLNDSKDRILATVAHDLRRPINHVQGLTQILQMQLGEAGKSNADLFERIEETCQKGLELINELLEMGELESEDYQLPTESVPFDKFVEKILEENQDDFEKASIILASQLNAPNKHVALNAGKFSRVLENLLVNAKKFTPEGGSVTVTTEVVGKHRVMLVISDTGIGIPKRLQPIIFDKFSKAGRTGLKGEKSTGLGMSIVKSVVELHRGQIYLESEEGQGTTFIIELPTVSASA